LLYRDFCAPRRFSGSALIGSRLNASLVCKTQWQWDEQRRIAKKEIDHDQIRGYSSH